ncbi:MAG: sensor histidine kinase, partial [Chitinophagaceae bacterium]
NNKGRYYTNVVHWTLLFSLPVFWLLDILFLPLDWVMLLFVRLFLAILTYTVYIYGNKKKWSFEKITNAFIIPNVIVNSIICSAVRVSDMLPYFLLFAIVILLFNITVFWKPFRSVIVVLTAYFTVAISFALINKYDDFHQLVTHGAGVFVVLTAFSLLIVNNRYQLLYREIMRGIEIENAQNRLVEQNEKIGEQWHQIEEVNRKLKNLSEYRYNTMNIMLHDFRSFTGSIDMSLDLMKNKDANLTEEQHEILKYIRVGNDKIKYLSERLANSAETDATVIEFDYEDIDLTLTVEKAVMNVADAAMMKQISLQLNNYPGELLVNLDKIFLDQVFFRLLSNIIRYSKSGTIISVHTQNISDKAVIEFINKGPLIGMDTLNGLFKELTNTTLQKEANTANSSLGFSIAKQLTEQMGGSLQYNSTEATGNYFRIEFKLTNQYA